MRHEELVQGEQEELLAEGTESKEGQSSVAQCCPQIVGASPRLPVGLALLLWNELPRAEFECSGDLGFGD